MGVASIKKSRGNFVEGVLYRISSKDLFQLDKFEAKGQRYERKKVYVTLKKKRKKAAWTYIAISDHNNNYPPSLAYLNLILKGAEEHNLSKNYIIEIKNGMN